MRIVLCVALVSSLAAASSIPGLSMDQLKEAMGAARKMNVHDGHPGPHAATASGERAFWWHLAIGA